MKINIIAVVLALTATMSSCGYTTNQDNSPAVKEIKDEYPDYQVEYLEGKCSPEEAAVYKADDAELKNEIMTLYNEVVGESEKLGEGSFVELDGGYAPILRVTDKDGNETQLTLITVSEGRTSDECLINVIYTGSNSDQCGKQAYRCGGETYDKLYDVLYGQIKAQEKS